MKYTSRTLKWMIPIIFLLISIVIYSYITLITQRNINGNELFTLVNDITSGYKLRQILVAVLMFIIGYILAQCIFEKQSDIVKAIWAMPISVVAWSMCSVVILFIRLPYIRSLMLGVVLILIFVVTYLRRDYIKKINLASMCRYIIWCVGLSIFFSTGIIPTIMSSDSYYYVMQYGEVIAKTGSLSFDTAGATMTWTGISSALISALACFGGFETITVIHNLLITSLLCCFCLTMMKQLENFGLDKKFATFWAIIFTIMLMIIPAFELLAFWVISNTYCMVYIFFLMIGLKIYISQECENSGLLMLLSMIVSWLALSRAEMSVCMACMVCLISVLPVQKRDMLILAVPMTILQLLYLIELDYQQHISERTVYDSMLTPQIQAIMLLALMGCIIYSLFIESKIFKQIRNRMSVILFVGIPLLYVGIYFMNNEKFIESIKSIGFNFTTQYWGYAPFIILILIMVVIWNKKNNYWMVFSAGYILINLALCLGRKQPLRDGYGDSCNRIMMSAIPIIFFALICSVSEVVLSHFKVEKEHEV